MGLILTGDLRVGKVYKVYEWYCSCGAIHRSKEEPKVLRCNACGGENGGIGRGQNYTLKGVSEGVDSYD